MYMGHRSANSRLHPVLAQLTTADAALYSRSGRHRRSSALRLYAWVPCIIRTDAIAEVLGNYEVPRNHEAVALRSLGFCHVSACGTPPSRKQHAGCVHRERAVAVNHAVPLCYLAASMITTHTQRGTESSMSPIVTVASPPDYSTYGPEARYPFPITP